MGEGEREGFHFATFAAVSPFISSDHLFCPFFLSALFFSLRPPHNRKKMATFVSLGEDEPSIEFLRLLDSILNSSSGQDGKKAIKLGEVQKCAKKKDFIGLIEKGLFDHAKTIFAASEDGTCTCTCTCVFTYVCRCVCRYIMYACNVSNVCM